MDETLITLSLTAAAAAVLVFGGLALRATLTRHRSARKLDTALSDMRATAANPAAPAASPVVPPAARPRPHGSREAQQLQQQIAKVGQRWIDTGLGRRIVTE
ncbi:hypothetical protein NMT55_24865, partial [Escherichia coli]|nr:hypothetical protein [Escherichia coli]